MNVDPQIGNKLLRKKILCLRIKQNTKTYLLQLGTTQRCINLTLCVSNHIGPIASFQLINTIFGSDLSGLAIAIDQYQRDGLGILEGFSIQVSFHDASA